MIVIQMVPQQMLRFTESVEEIVPERNNGIETLRVIVGLFSVVSVFHVCKIIKIIDRL